MTTPVSIVIIIVSSIEYLPSNLDEQHHPHDSSCAPTQLAAAVPESLPTNTSKGTPSKI